MIGRSAIHGEPITFGFKLAGWRKPNATAGWTVQTDVVVGQISGAWAPADPQVEAITCDLLGLNRTPPAQVIRDRHADYVQTRPGGPHWIAFTEIRNLQRRCARSGRFCQGQKAVLPPTNATPSGANGSAAWRGCCAVMWWLLSRRALARAGHQPQLHRANDVARRLRHTHFMLREMTAVVQGLCVPRQHAPQHEHLRRSGVVPAGAAGFGGKRDRRTYLMVQQCPQCLEYSRGRFPCQSHG